MAPGATHREPPPRDVRGASADEIDAIVRELYRSVGPRVLALGYRYFAGRADLAEDLVAETFARVLVGIRRFEGRSSYGTWVFRVALNVAAQWARAEARRPQETLAAEPAVPPATPDAVASAERRARVREALAALSPDHRIVLALVVVDGVSQAEVAELLGVAPGTVWSRYARARIALAREFARRGLGAEDLG